jgi:CubicO group peptidase (beta-lactamase class C family)
MKINRIASVIAAAALCLLTVPLALATQSQAPLPVDATLDGFIMQRMDEAGIVGLGAAIIVDKRVVWSQGYGFADRETATPFTPDTVMNIGSISKTITGVAMMHAVQEGKLSLDEDINHYLPFKVSNPHYPQEKITLRQLATHTSGITDSWPVYRRTYHYGGDAPQALGEFLAGYFTPGGAHYSTDNFLNARPGRLREYSNIGAGLAGYIVEMAVKAPLNLYSKRHIFTPLQMDNTAWFLSEVPKAKHSRLYVAQDGLSIPIPLYGATTYPDGGVRTSVADLSKFFIALLNDGHYEDTAILHKPMVDQMLSFQYTDANKPENVNLAEDNSGLFWATKRNLTWIGHGGSDPGVKTEMLADLSKEIGVILFSNTSLSGQELRQYFAIFLEIWKHAEALKTQAHPDTET